MEIEAFKYYHGVVVGTFDGLKQFGLFSCFAQSLDEATQMAENEIKNKHPFAEGVQVALERIDVATIAYQLMALEKKHNENDSAK